MRYFIHLGFDGSDYSGWQKQKNTANTVQEIFEQNLVKVLKKEVTAYGCGRTDAGVHASQFVLQINLDQAPDFDLKFRLNKNLPDTIAIFDIIEVDENHHCRYDATSRTYDYFIHTAKDPALSRLSSFYEDLSIDLEVMKKAAELILNTSDFKALCKHPNFYKNTKCQITNCQLFYNEAQGRLRFTITSNRFLRGMVRLCVYFLIKVGTEKLSLANFEKILNQEIEGEQKKPAPPNGLFLSKIEYPFLELSNPHHLIKVLKIGLD